MTKPTVTDEMVNRFLSWRLPSSFNPDCGISFKRTYNESSPYGPAEHEPTGTNLLDAVQARAMLEHVLAGCTQAPAATEAPSHWCALEHGGVFCDVCTRRGELVKSGWFATPAPAVGASSEPSDLTRAKNLLVRLWDKHPAARAQIEASTGSWFVWGQDRDVPAAVGASPEPEDMEEAEHAAWRTDYAKGAAQMLRRWPTPPAVAVTKGTNDVRDNALTRGIRALMSRLASLLDEDQFKDCEDIVRQAGVAPAPNSDPTASYSNLGRVAFEAINPGKVFTHLPAHEMQRWEAAADAVRLASPASKALHRLSEIAACLGAHWPDDHADDESIRRITWLTREFNKRSTESADAYAWEATTIGYKRFVTDDWYQKSSDAVKRWYKPYRCTSCAAVGASVQPAAGALPPVRWWSGVVGSPEKLANLLDGYSEKKESPRRDERVMRAAAKWIREVVASVQPVLASLSDAIDGPRYRWLRANREAQAEDGTLLDVYDEDGTMLSHESLDRAIDAALASSTPTKGGEAS